MIAPEHLIQRLAATLEWLDVEPGLSDAEFGVIEKRYGFVFPSDLRDLLGHGLLTSKKHQGWGFPNWREPESEKLAKQLAWPVEGLLFDVEHNDLWLGEWGQRPEGTHDAVRLAQQLLRGVPTLVPVYNHRYICTEPSEPGNPILSIQQADIIYYGGDLEEFFDCQFFGKHLPESFPKRVVPFWHQFTDGSVSGGL
jgi:hypothetical protein